MSANTSRRVFKVHIDTERDAFGNEYENPFGDSTANEVARILHVLAERVEDLGASVVKRDSDDPFMLMDVNGNTVGKAHFTYEDDE